MPAFPHSSRCLTWLTLKGKLSISSHLSFILPRNMTAEVCMAFDLFKVAMLNFHSFDWQCFGSFVVSQLTSGDSLSVGIAHIHMAEHDDFSVLPSRLRFSRGSTMLAPHLVWSCFVVARAFVELVCWPRCHNDSSDLISHQWCITINANYSPLNIVIDFDWVKKE